VFAFNRNLIPYKPTGIFEASTRKAIAAAVCGQLAAAAT
jgi:hypothetical protein